VPRRTNVDKVKEICFGGSTRRRGNEGDDEVWKSLLGKANKQLPAAPEGMRIYAIGDIHGRADLLNRLFTEIDADSARSPDAEALEIYLGDYLDRGPASRQVIDDLIARGRSRRAVFLKGNHETYPLEFLRDPTFFGAWSQLGGRETLISYGVLPPIAPGPNEWTEIARAFAAALPAEHRDFLQDLQPYACYGDFYFVHGGVRPGVPLERQREEDLLEIREPFLSSQVDFGKVVIHGHTPALEPEFRPNRIGIDTGAYATGKLTCLVISGDTLRIL
jgi:serine/threonine protein phosphatase 1